MSVLGLFSLLNRLLLIALNVFADFAHALLNSCERRFVQPISVASTIADCAVVHYLKNHIESAFEVLALGASVLNFNKYNPAVCAD